MNSTMDVLDITTETPTMTMTEDMTTGEFTTREFTTGEFTTGEFTTGEFTTGDFRTGAGSAPDENREPIIALGIFFIIVALGFTTALLFGALANCLHKRWSKRNRDSRLEIKSSARRHGPSAFVKDADFAYIDIEKRSGGGGVEADLSSSTGRKKRMTKSAKWELERYRSLERYHAVKVDGEGSELSPSGSGVTKPLGVVTGPRVHVVGIEGVDGPYVHDDDDENFDTQSLGGKIDIHHQQQVNVNPAASTILTVQTTDDIETKTDISTTAAVHEHATTSRTGSSKPEVSYPSPRPDILDQVPVGAGGGGSHTQLSASQSSSLGRKQQGGGTTIIYVVGDAPDRKDVPLRSAHAHGNKEQKRKVEKNVSDAQPAEPAEQAEQVKQAAGKVSHQPLEINESVVERKATGEKGSATVEEKEEREGVAKVQESPQMSGYIEQIDGADFEDPREYYISHL